MCVRQRTTWQDCVLKASCQARTVSGRATSCSPTRYRWRRPCWRVVATARCCSPSRLALSNSSSRTSSRTTPFQVRDDVEALHCCSLQLLHTIPPPPDNIRSKGPRSRSHDYKVQKAIERPAWVMHSIECLASSLLQPLLYCYNVGILEEFKYSTTSIVFSYNGRVCI